MSNCLFCKIVQSSIPCAKIYETSLSLVFLDISPLSKGHCLVVPKFHAKFMHELPDSSLSDILPTASKVAKALNMDNYNILQNNGRLAHQAVDHVHFHIIPKDASSGLVIEWDPISPSKEELSILALELSDKIARMN